MRRPLALAATVVALVAAAAGCGGGGGPAVPGGDSATGKELLRQFGCAGCHAIPGIRGADARVGPSLHGLSERATIAGAVPNRVPELVRWISDPQAVAPGTIMPALGVTREQALDIAAYLYGQG